MSTIVATLQALALLGTGALIALLLVVGVVASLAHSGRWSRRAMSCAVAVAGLYATLLLAAGVHSKDWVIPVGQRKMFCELDCHVAYVVVDRTRSADGQLIAITIRELFDPSTISEHRGNSPLWPGDRRFALVDNAGHRIAPLSIAPVGTPPLGTPFAPGESHLATLTFPVSRNSEPMALLVEADDPISPFLIGHERSPFHSKVLLSLVSNTASSGF